MPTFWDLPRNVRDKVYRFSLVQEGVIDPAGFKKACGIETDWWHYKHGMPFLLQLCERTEQEAAEIFFGENTFFARITETHVWHGMIYPRHFKLIRKFSVGGWDWPETYGPGYTSGFRMLRSFKSLDTVTVTINEQESLEDLLSHRSTIKWHKSLGLSPQLHLKVLNFNGIPGLRSLRNIYRINFKSKSLRQRTATGDGDEFERGDIVGGFLDTTLRQEIAGPIKPKKHRRKGKFRFLDLPPEVRNIIYTMLLSFPGVTYPVAEKPTSVTSQYPYLRKVARKEVAAPNSALAILGTNHEIYKEASSIFYQNDFVFSYPTHLQAFTLSLEPERLQAISSLTLFHKDHNEGGTHTMDITMKLLRRMSGLKKFHLLVEKHLAKRLQRTWSLLAETTPSEIHGVSILFSLRGLTDILVRDLELEDFYPKTALATYNGPPRQDVEHKVQMLKHFNHGLALAQQGVVVEELYEDDSWPYQDEWPPLGNVECGMIVGCLCGTEEDEVQEASEDERSGDEDSEYEDE